ncbi:hypothetical protein [Olivibacter sp. XZL3]|uniref:hypothetical protein n=1 Tax=Olivibacter sp. XZL3 TaxID=1735116 RepID=UPI001066CDE8|nr:hypothetical protein [Olivibacter sp. XZL3]
MKKSVLIGASLLIVMGCSKQQSPQAESKQLESGEKLINYLHITTNTPKNEITYNATKDSLVLKGWYKVSIKEIQDQYNNANEYKANYEENIYNENN